MSEPSATREVLACAATAEMVAAIDHIIGTGEYHNRSEYIRDLLRRDLIQRGRLGQSIPQAEATQPA